MDTKDSFVNHGMTWSSLMIPSKSLILVCENENLHWFRWRISRKLSVWRSLHSSRLEIWEEYRQKDGWKADGEESGEVDDLRRRTVIARVWPGDQSDEFQHWKIIGKLENYQLVRDPSQYLLGGVSHQIPALSHKLCQSFPEVLDLSYE